MAEGNAIGEFLRARRELVRPEDVGIPKLDRRRVPGLRRSELAMLAGISTEYYVRLEQGSDRHPSTLVLEALARALQLDEHATAHLHRLAAPVPRRVPRRRIENVSPQIDVLLRSLDPTTPAYVTGRLTNVLAANTLATAVLPLLVPGAHWMRAKLPDWSVPEMDFRKRLVPGDNGAPDSVSGVLVDGVVRQVIDQAKGGLSQRQAVGSVPAGKDPANLEAGGQDPANIETTIDANGQDPARDPADIESPRHPKGQ
jgi:transcriptional regulator with XRE-family HTH domain